MICAWMFMISNQVVNSDSNYKFMKSMINGLNDEDLFVVFFPRSKQVKYEPDGFFNSDNILPVVYKAPSKKILQSTHFDSQFIFKKVHEHGCNVVWNNVIEISPQLHQIFNTFRPTKLPMIVGYPHYTLHPSISYPMHTYPALRVMGLTGNYISDLLLYNSQYHYSMMKDNLKEFHVMGWEKEIRDKTTFVPIPVLDDELRRFMDESNGFDINPDKVLFYYNHRLQNYKQWKTTFGMWKNLWDSGHKNFEVQMSYNSGDNAMDGSAYPFVQLNKTHKHEEYYQKLMQPHFNTINTSHETFCIAIVESGLLGGIPIVPKRVTFPELFPKKYNWFFHDDQEQKEIIKNILTGGYEKEYLVEEKTKIRQHLSQYNVEDMGKLADHAIKKELNYRNKWMLDHLKPVVKDRFIKFIKKMRGKELPLKKLHIQSKKATGQGNQSITSYNFISLLENFNHQKRFHNKQVYLYIE